MKVHSLPSFFLPSFLPHREEEMVGSMPPQPPSQRQRAMPASFSHTIFHADTMSEEAGTEDVFRHQSFPV